MKFLAALFFLLACFFTVAYSQTIKHSYRFYNNLSVASPECGPDLVPTQAAGSCTAAPTGGSFISENIPYCGITRTVYADNQNWGLQYPNTDGTIGNTYTIQLYLRPTSFGSIWTRIIDFSNGLSDNGIYFHSGSGGYCLYFYPNGPVGACPYFDNSTYYLLSFTRDASTDSIKVYVNNTLFTSYYDATGTYKGTPGTPIYIYRDDQVVTCESGGVNIAYLAFTNQYSTQADVDKVYSEICSIANINNAADFSFNPTSSCDLTQNITVTYTGDIPLPASNYTFTWGWDGGTVVSGTGTGPYQVNWNTVGTKNISLNIQNTTCGNNYDTIIPFDVTTGYDIIIDTTICQGTTFMGHNSSGTFTNTYTTSGGCDSVVTLKLAIVGTFINTVSKVICSGETFQGHATSGAYIDTLFSRFGCDSIVTLNLTVLPPVIENASVYLCPGVTYELPDGEIVSTSGIHFDTVQTALGCDSIIITYITVPTEIAGSAVTTDASCAENNDGSIMLSATDGAPPYLFEVTGVGSNTSGVFDNLPPGNYNYTIYDANTCAIFGGATINSPEKIIVYVHPVDTTIDAGNAVSLTASANHPNLTYTWAPATYLTCNTCAITTSNPAIGIVYTLTVSESLNGNTCIVDTTITIRVNDVKPHFPNVFSPNGDGVNDVFTMIEEDTHKIGSLQVQIFNRWGQKVYENQLVDFSWDGTYQFTKQPIGVYGYYIKYTLLNSTGEHILKGNISIIR